MRVEDGYKFEGEVANDSLYGGARDGRQGFRRFLRLVENRRELLPSWWSQEKAAECVSVGLGDGWSSLARAIEKSDVIEHYGHSLMPMQLRMFAEQVYGRGLGGSSAASTLQMLMTSESRGGYMSHIDIS